MKKYCLLFALSLIACVNEERIATLQHQMQQAADEFAKTMQIEKPYVCGPSRMCPACEYVACDGRIGDRPVSWECIARDVKVCHWLLNK